MQCLLSCCACPAALPTAPPSPDARIVANPVPFCLSSFCHNVHNLDLPLPAGFARHLPHWASPNRAGFSIGTPFPQERGSWREAPEGVLFLQTHVRLRATSLSCSFCCPKSCSLSLFFSLFLCLCSKSIRLFYRI